MGLSVDFDLSELLLCALEDGMAGLDGGKPGVDCGEADDFGFCCCAATSTKPMEDLGNPADVAIAAWGEACVSVLTTLPLLSTQTTVW